MATSNKIDAPTANQQNLIDSNERYASSFTEGHLALPPAKKYLVGMPINVVPRTSITEAHELAVTCMDARIDPKSAFGINLGDAHVIRNAGGNAKDALRSILISQHLLGTREVILVKHVPLSHPLFLIPTANLSFHADWLWHAHIRQF